MGATLVFVGLVVFVAAYLIGRLWRQSSFSFRKKKYKKIHECTTILMDSLPHSLRDNPDFQKFVYHLLDSVEGGKVSIESLSFQLLKIKIEGGKYAGNYEIPPVEKLSELRVEDLVWFRIC